MSTGEQKSVAPKNQWYIVRNHRRSISSSGVAWFRMSVSEMRHARLSQPNAPGGGFGGMFVGG